jgi:hypothetical protein
VLHITSWNRVLLKTPPVAQLLVNIKIFYWTRSFITILSQMSPVHTTPSLRFILILSSHRCLDLPSGRFPSDFPTKVLRHSPSPPFVLHALPISSSFDEAKSTSYESPHYEVANCSYFRKCWIPFTCMDGPGSWLLTVTIPRSYPSAVMHWFRKQSVMLAGQFLQALKHMVSD